MNRLAPENNTEREEKKADNLMPEAMHRFDDSRHDMLQKGTPLLDCQTLLHPFIVTNTQKNRFQGTGRQENCR